MNLFGGCIIESYCVVDSGEFKHVHDLCHEPAASFFLPLKSSSVPLHISSQVVGVLVAFYQVGVAGRIITREGFQAVCVETVQSRLKEVAEVSVSVVCIGAKEENTHKHQSPSDTRNESHLTQTPPLRSKVKVSLSVTSQRTRNLSSAFDPFRNNSVIEPPKSLTLNTTGSEYRGLNPQRPNLVARSPTQSYSQPYILPRIQLQPRVLKRRTRSQSKERGSSTKCAFHCLCSLLGFVVMMR